MCHTHDRVRCTGTQGGQARSRYTGETCARGSHEGSRGLMPSEDKAETMPADGIQGMHDLAPGNAENPRYARFS